MTREVESVPFTGPIFGGLRVGKMILIQGQPQLTVKSFAVNLLCPNGDVAFHFNPRFDEGRVVVCNSQQGGRWGPEERALGMAFQAGAYFELIVHVQAHCYQVSINGSHFLEYRHRVPFYSVQTLEVKGDLSLNHISFPERNVPPPFAPPAYSAIAATHVSSAFAQPNFGPPRGSVSISLTGIDPMRPQGNNNRVTLSNPAVPLLVAIPACFTQNRKITIVGNVPHNANRFHVNLKNSLNGNVALHVNPRLKEGELVRNTQVNGSWGSEERHGSAMPFSRGQAFQMEITSQKAAYQVTVNGVIVCQYTHRIPPGQVDQLEIAGDVSLSCVQY
ncbi:hypothetical protein lerEdw1_009909 [Lerista edwardsae]|nr:hypothetical protein lerEdw1_009909 [Lerista edwardsae]